MKKFKFFALAALLGMSINAMADEQSNGTFTYTIAKNAETGNYEATLTGFVNELSASKQATVTIPATVKGKDGKTYPVVYVDGSASESTKFAGNKKIKKVALAANSNLTTIYGGSFQGAENLATVTLTNGSKLSIIGPAAFDGTAITTLDLTPTIMENLDQIFTDGSEPTKNKKLTTVKLPAKMKNILFHAFQNCMQLATIDFSKCNPKEGLTIGAYAFDNCLFFKELELPACVARIADFALCNSRIEKLTITSSSTSGNPTIGAIANEYDKLTSIIVNGAFQGKFGLDDDGNPVTVSKTVKSLTFNGAVKANAIAAGAFVEASELANVTFNSTVAKNAVMAGAFGDGTNYAGESLPIVWGSKQLLLVSYSPEEKDANKVMSINKEAFAPSAGAAIATLSTTTWYKKWIEDKGGIYQVNISAAAETKTIEVANNGEGKYYYATFYDEDGDYKIAAEQNDGKVMVYSAYVDETPSNYSQPSNGTWSNQVYMEQLTIYGGFYWIPAGVPVIVKSTTSDDVIATRATKKPGTPTSLHYDENGAANNGIYTTSQFTWYLGEDDVYGVELKEMVANEFGDWAVPYILAPIEEYGLTWTKFKDERNIPVGTFFILANNGDPEYARVIWTDGSEEEATAIKTVKKANAENGAQFNLAGQKVNAAYKGIIIKDGKKMIQK